MNEVNETSETCIEIINLTEIIQQEIARRGLIFGYIDVKLPETVEVLCGKPKTPFVVTDELIKFAYPGDIIYKQDFDIIKEKIKESFFELLLDEQKILTEYFEKRLSPADKNKMLKDVSSIRRNILKREDRILNAPVKIIKNKIRQIFSKKYRPDVFEKTLEEIKDFKRKDFIVIKPQVYKKTELDDTRQKELPWRRITEIDPIQYPNWTVEDKINCFQRYFRKWL